MRGVKNGPGHGMGWLTGYAGTFSRKPGCWRVEAAVAAEMLRF